MRSNRYVSYLAAEVEPRAISTISRFERDTQKAFERIARFNDRGAAKISTAALGGFNSQATAGVRQTAAALGQVQSQAARAAPAIRQATTETRALSTAFLRSSQALNIVQGPLGALSGRLSSIGFAFRDLAGLSLAGVLGGGGAFAIGSIASQYAKVTDRLRPLYETQQQANNALRQVIGISRDTRQALDPIAQLYGRISSAAKDAGIQVNASKLTETVAKAARLSGGDADTQQAGIGQFLQGFGSGTLAGDELKSIRENTFRLAKAIADGLGVPIAKLKELGSEGKLTPQVVAEALARSADQIDKEFATLPLRIGQSLTQAGANLSIFFGRLDEASGATTGFAKAIQLAGNNIPIVLAGAAGLASAFAARNLATPINSATTALQKFIGTQALISNVRAGNVIATPLTPTGIARAKATSAAEAAGADARVAQANVATQRAALAVVDERIAKTRQIIGIEAQLQERQLLASADAVTKAEVLVAAAREELALVNQTSAARVQGANAAALATRNRLRAEAAGARGEVTRLNQGISATYTAAEGEGGSRSDRNRIARTAARQRVALEAELAVAQDRAAAAAARLEAAEVALNTTRAAGRGQTAEQVVATQQLAAAELELAAATRANSIATTQNSAAANTNAARGFAALTQAERRIAVEIELTAAIAAETIANNVATGALGRLVVAQRAFAAASTLSARALAGLSAAGAKLAGFFGGPLGIALTAATVAFTLLATRTDEARDASERFSARQDELASKLATSSEAFERAAKSAAAYRLELAQAGLAEAKKRQTDAGASLANSLTDAASNIDLSTSQGRADFARTRELAEAARNGGGRSGQLRLSEIQAIRARNQSAFSDSTFGRLLGSNPGDVGLKAVGFKETALEIGDARRAVREAQARIDAPIKPPPVLGGGGIRRTNEQLEAEAGDLASGGTRLAQARKDFNKTKADLDAERDRRHKAGDYSFDDTYVQKLAAAQTQLNRVGDAQRAAAAGARAHRKEIAEQNKELTAARERAEKLAGITSRYETPETAVRRGNADKADVDSLFVRIKDGAAIVSETVQLLNQKTGKLEPFTRADAEEVKRRIDENVRRPISDAIKEQGRELEVSRLILAGRADEADLLRQKYQLIDRVGNVTSDELRQLRENAAEQRRINAEIEQRNRLIEIQVRAYGVIQNSVRDLARAAPDIAGGLLKGAGALVGGLAGGRGIRASLSAAGDAAGGGLSAIKSVVETVSNSFRDAIADKISTALFGDAEAEARDAMTRGLNTSAGRLSTAADALIEAAGALQGDGPLDAPILGSSALSRSLIDLPDLSGVVASNEKVAQAIEDQPEEIVVQASPEAKRRAQEGRGANLSIEQRYNEVGTKFASKIFGENSPLTRAAGKLGTFLSGAQYAPVGQGLVGALGGKGSNLGAAIGGGLGKTLLGGENGLIAKGLGAIGGKLGGALGQFAGPLGSIAGSVVGSLIGGLFKKTKQASSTVTVSAAGATSTTGVGQGSDARVQATGLGSGVASGITKIAQALGGSPGNASVSIGYRPGHKDPAYRVDTTGQGRLTGVQAFETEKEAIEYAIVTALKQGAINGIREGTKRLLAAGNDLDGALEKALRFEDVFKQLKAYTDPVGAAIDTLNLEFKNLISLFNEAGASSGEFADLQKLYDYRRADAIKQAASSTVDTYDKFIKGLTSSTDSPLSRRTAYNNAQKELDTFRADIAAGKVVDSDKLIAALENVQGTSSKLNGSRSAFYQDFESILALAEKARANVAATTTNGGTYASPFDNPAVISSLDATSKNTAGIIDAINQQTRVMQQLGGGGGGGVESSLSYLPSALTA